MKAAKIDTNYGILMFQNSMRNMGSKTMDLVKKEVNEAFGKIRMFVEESKKLGFEHKVAIAEEQFVPELKEYFEEIDYININIGSITLANVYRSICILVHVLR